MVRIALSIMIERLLLLYLILGFTISQAQELSASGAASISLAGADLCLKNSWAANNNPAALSKLDRLSFAAANENSFLIQELSSRAFVFNLPQEKHAFALSGQQFGFDNFRQHKLGLAYAQKLAPKLSMGLQFNYHQTQLSDPYGKEAFYTVNLGLITQINPKLELASSIINPNRVNSPEAETAYYPQILKIGLAYQAEEYLSLMLQTEKELEKALNTIIGVQYTHQKKLHLRVGIAHQPRRIAFGFSYQHQWISFDLASSYSFQLGFSPAISLSFYPLSNEK